MQNFEEKSPKDGANMSIKEKMVLFCGAKNITVMQMAQDIKASATNFSTSNLRSAPGGDIILRFLQKYPEVSAEWLLRGEGTMFRNGNINVTTDNTGRNAMVIGVNAGTASNGGVHKESTPTDMQTLLLMKDDMIHAKDAVIKSKEDLIKSKQDLIDIQKLVIDALMKETDR